MTHPPYKIHCGCTHYGVRGLKYVGENATGHASVSHPSRGAWIEINKRSILKPIFLGHAPHGACGLKFRMFFVMTGMAGRTPHGVRGLKSLHNL